MRRAPVLGLLSTLFLGSTFLLVLVHCAHKSAPPPEEPAVSETASDAGAADEESAVDSAPPPTLYDRLGGKDGVAAIVESFAANLLADPRVSKPFKKSKDKLAHFKQTMADEICVLAAGPCTYAGKPMKEAHKGMGITDAQFDAFVEDLKLALDEKGVGDQEKNDLLTAVGPARADVVEKKGKGK
jgi:hemoglobin